MLNSFPFLVLVGSVLGLLSGLGVGGGSLLILWLTLVLGTEYSTAKLINLLFFLPSAIIASLFRWKQGSLDLRRIMPGIVSGCISAALFAFIGQRISTELLQKLFGGILLLTGCKELLYRPKS